MWSKFKKEGYYLRKNSELLILSIPCIVFKLIFNYMPMFGIVLAFKKFYYDKGFWGSPWVGLDNFKFFFSSSKAFEVLRNTILYNLAGLTIGFACSIGLALLAHEISKKWLKIYQTIFILPHFLSWVVIGYISVAFFDHQYGFINNIIAAFGNEPVNWYFTPKFWPFILIGISLWKETGFSSILYYTAILGIDPTYFEAAKIDGATKWQQYRYITLPSISVLISINIILSLSKIIRSDFGLFFFVPNDSSFLYSVTDTIDTYVYRSLRVSMDVGTSSAVGMFQSVVGVIMLLIANYIIGKINEENALI